MKAIAIVPGTPGARIVERPEPSVSAPDDVKLRVIRVGICGTGREELSAGTIVGAGGAEGTRNRPRATGAAVKSVKEGDYAVFTVRRPCGPVRPLPDGPRRHVRDGRIWRARHPGPGRL